jgi:uroporphyrinogen-III synthase
VNGALAGLAVVVTRPAAQAAPMARALEAEGAEALLLPSLRIEPVRIDAAALATADPARYDDLVYTSVNAVESALAQLPRPRGARLFAVGSATKAALAAHGLEAIAPDGPDAANSEGLLALPELATPAGRRILILRGVGGRELLPDTLRVRGAEVACAELYRRAPAPPDLAVLARIAALRRAGHSCVLAVSSVEALDGLLAGIGAHWRAELLALPLLVPGSRVAAAAAARGHSGAAILAASAELPAQLDRLRRWWATNGTPRPAC